MYGHTRFLRLKKFLAIRLNNFSTARRPQNLFLRSSFMISANRQHSKRRNEMALIAFVLTDMICKDRKSPKQYANVCALKRRIWMFQRNESYGLSVIISLH